MATKKLAKRLGSVRKRSQSSTGQNKLLVSNQIFSYLIVIDFESTCWREKNNYGPEIIEFPAVLLNTSTGEIESEFHTYVQPQEHPVLSEFCTELTGITQSQVEAGVPLHICLGRFSRWLQALQLQKGVTFARDQRPGSAPSASNKSCAFVTWSDWDLGVCLQYECKRKQLHKPDVLNSWIDLRATYKSFYNKKPKGLNGALQDLGIQFSGREHSGLDDARNTAQLALRMMQDGCVMKITRSQERKPLQTTLLFGNANNHVTSKKEKDDHFKEETVLATAKTSSCKTPESCQPKPYSENHNLVVDTKKTSHSIQELAQDVQSLVSPRTLLNGVTTPVYGNRSRRSKAETTTNLSSGMVINNMSLRNNNNNSKSLILVSTTVDCLPHLHQLIQSSESRETVGLVQQEERANIVVEMDEGCGSYDAVVLECDDVINNLYTDITNASECGSGCPLIREEPKHSVWSCTKLQSMNCMTRNPGEEKYPKTKKTENCTARCNMSTPINKEGLNHFAMPKPFNQNSESLASTSNHLTGECGSGCPLIREETKHSVWSCTKLQSMSCMTRNAVEEKYSKTKKTENCTARCNMSTPINKEGLYHFAMPKPFNQNSESLASTSNHLTGANGKASKQRKEESGTSHYESRKLGSSLRPMSSVSDKTNTLFMRPMSVLSHQNPTRTHSKINKEPVKTSFTIFTDTASHSALSHSSSSCGANIQQRCGPSSVQTPSALSSLSTNHLTAALTSRRITCKITAPLCACGRRSKRQIVANGGPNHGRGFYCCPVRRSGSGNGIQKGCQFFKWEAALIQGNSKKHAAASSVSLGFNSSLYCHPPQTSTLRKSY